MSLWHSYFLYITVLVATSLDRAICAGHNIVARTNVATIILKRDLVLAVLRRSPPHGHLVGLTALISPSIDLRVASHHRPIPQQANLKVINIDNRRILQHVNSPHPTHILLAAPAALAKGPDHVHNSLLVVKVAGVVEVLGAVEVLLEVLPGLLNTLDGL